VSLEKPQGQAVRLLLDWIVLIGHWLDWPVRSGIRVLKLGFRRFKKSLNDVHSQIPTSDANKLKRARAKLIFVAVEKYITYLAGTALISGLILNSSKWNQPIQIDTLNPVAFVNMGEFGAAIKAYGLPMSYYFKTAALLQMPSPHEVLKKKNFLVRPSPQKLGHLKVESEDKITKGGLKKWQSDTPKSR